MTSFAGKTAFVTGAASGVGAEVAGRLHDAGATVFAADLAAVAPRGDRWLPVSLDVRAEGQWLAAMVEVAGRIGRLDILVNCAGIIRGQTIEQSDMATWEAVIGTNATGTMLGCKHAIGLMKGGSGGAIVNVSSGIVRRPQAGQVAYGASKAAIEAITKSAALHCAQSGYGIRVNCVQPGALDSTMLRGNRPPTLTEEKFLASVVARHPIGRLGTYEEIAKAILFLVSDDASYVTGAVWSVDGGMSI